MPHFYMKQAVKAVSYHLASRTGKAANPSSLLFLGANRSEDTTLNDAGKNNL